MTLFAAGLAGFAVLAVEILGVHMLMPWFGSSALVWSQQIGIVLAAIALGGWAGGQVARRSADPQRAAALLLGGGGLLLAATVGLLDGFAAAITPQALALEEAAGVFLKGSFAAALLFFAPPVFLLSAVAPLLVQVRSTERGAGLAAGEVSAAGTVGSLLGVFGSAFVAIPFLGVRLTLAGCAVALLLAAALLTRRAPAAALGLLPLLALALPVDAARAHLPDGARLVEARESSYQHLRVIEFDGGERWLQMNEGLDSYQSRSVPGSAWPGGYYDLFLLAPLYAEADRPAQTPARIWILGFGAGSGLAPTVAGLRGRACEVVGVELDPVVTELTQRHMPLATLAGVTVNRVDGADARALLRAAKPGLDVIVLDCYARQFEIPLHLATEEFFAEAWRKLRPGGVLALNVGLSGSVEAGDAFLGRVRRSLQSSFGDALRMHRVPYSRNWVIYARREAGFLSLAELADRMPAGVPVEVGAACLPGQTLEGPVAAGLAPFTDDRNPLQLAQLRQWWEDRGSWRP